MDCFALSNTQSGWCWGTAGGSHHSRGKVDLAVAEQPCRQVLFFLCFPLGRIQKDGRFCAKARMLRPGEFWFGPCPNPADLFLSMCFDDQKAVQISNSTLLPQVSKCFLKRTGPCVMLTAWVWGTGWCGKSLCTPEAGWALRVSVLQKHENAFCIARNGFYKTEWFFQAQPGCC